MNFINKLRGSATTLAARPPFGRDVRVSATPLQAPSTPALQNGEETSGRFSNGLKEFLWHIGDIGKGSLLDLGAVSQATVTFFIERNFKVYTEDLLAGWGAFLEHESQRAASLARTEQAYPSPTARADRFLGSNLRYAADSFHAVLLWDICDYLDKEAARQFLRRISPLVRKGGAVLAIFHPRAPEQFQRYRVLDGHNLEAVNAPRLVQPRHVYNNREIQELFETFRTCKTFVVRDQLREGVFVK